MNSLRLLLFPFAIVYGIITSIRNYLYDIGQKKSFEFTIPVISVGNLNTGGSGKTPMIEYLIRLLKDSENIATLSRGYGRRTKGLRFATKQDTALSIGDEPFQFYKKFGHEVNVTVGEDRAFAIPNILNEYPDTSVILLDDAFQHRSVKPHFSILVTEYSKPFFNDFMLPVGNLRESPSGVSRANLIVVTKCPLDLASEEIKSITSSIARYSSAPIFFSCIKYSSVVQFTGDQITNQQHVVLISGIANADAFEKQCSSMFQAAKHFRFADHHRYTKSEIEEVKKFIEGRNEPISIITTEKDMARLSSSELLEIIKEIPCFYLPIEMVFLENGSVFDKLVIDASKLPEEA